MLHSSSNNAYANKHYDNQDSFKKEPTSDNDSKKEESTLSDADSPLFQIFGINLYFDDVLIVCILLFLYQEGVKDESLFIVLILLLLS
jgi:hypothetical protein